MKKFKSILAPLPGTLAAFLERRRRGVTALANDLGLMFEHGIETLLIEPASGSLPVTSRYLIYKRGTTADNYCDVCTASDYPLGISSDSPYQAGDYVNIRRFGAKKGIEIGIAAAAITIDHLVYVTAAGKIADLTLATTGTLWVIGRANKTVAATNSTMECSFVPCTPYQITVNSLGSYSAVTPSA